MMNDLSKIRNELLRISNDLRSGSGHFLNGFEKKIDFRRLSKNEILPCLYKEFTAIIPVPYSLQRLYAEVRVHFQSYI